MRFVFNQWCCLDLCSSTQGRGDLKKDLGKNVDTCVQHWDSENTHRVTLWGFIAGNLKDAYALENISPVYKQKMFHS